MGYQSWRGLVFIGAMLVGSTALAAVDCEKAIRQAEMNQCAADDFKREDAKLNTLYQELVGRLNPADAARLKAIQRAWVVFRDLHCDYEEDRYEGGSMAQLVGFGCLRRLTRQRNETLGDLLKDFH